MIKSNILNIFIIIFLLNISSNNLSFASELGKTQNLYPDYAYEFTGKDTCEKFNRKLFIFNLKLNKYIIRPVNIVWASLIPKYGMDRLQNAYNNMDYPLRLVSCLIQKDFKASKNETIRFLTNTTIGLGGLYDPAKNKFKIEPCNEDLEQALAQTKIKQGPYLVLPTVQGNVRSLVGKLLDWPLRPTSYVGPFGAVANAVFAVNNTTYSQPMIEKVDETYADPYELAKQVDGINSYIKNENLDREDVFKKKTALQNIIQVSKISKPQSNTIKADIKLIDYNSQGSFVDSTRTAFFDNQKLNKPSIWSQISIWNRDFNKKIKTASVKLTPDRKKYKYRYILQKNKISPLAVIYPSIGENIMSDKSIVLTKILYDNGYSVAILGSSFQWEFVNSMPEHYAPGNPQKDAKQLRAATAKIINNIKKKNKRQFSKKILIGCSFGALTNLFVAEQEAKDKALGKKTLKFSKYIAISPPIDLFFALKQLDKYSGDWKNDPSDIKMRTAITAEKIVHVYKNIHLKETKDMVESMPFTNDEAKLAIGFVMKQKLSDVIFAVDGYSRTKKNGLCDVINKMSFYDYGQKYLFIDKNKSQKELEYEASLYCLTDFLRKSRKYKIYNALDDYFTSSAQLAWLKKQTNKKSVFFSNGSHLGFMYRKEFMNEFKKDIMLQGNTSPAGL